MATELEEKNRALVLKAFDTLFNKFRYLDGDVEAERRRPTQLCFVPLFTKRRARTMTIAAAIDA